MSSLRAGAIGIAIIAFAVYMAFKGPIPFTGSPFVLEAMFTQNTNLHVKSPVRIAGVNVGVVTGVTPAGNGSTAGIVSMQIDSNGLPIHTDATIHVRPRIFLEGNWYVDLSPGTPSAPIVKSGGMLPAANATGPVQLDRVLSALGSDTRTDLEAALRGFGASLNQPTAQSLNRALQYSTAALKASAIVNEALLGTAPHDLSGTVTGGDNVLRALATRQPQLTGLVTSFDATMAALAARQQQLRQTLGDLPALLRATDGANTKLDASFAPTQAFARELLPGVNQTAATIDAALPWNAQAQRLVSKTELGGLLNDLTPAVQGTGSAIGSARTLVTALDSFNRCLLGDLIPTGNEVISDPPLSSTYPVYDEIYQGAVGLAGALQGFDGNGRFIRVQTGGGPVATTSSPLPQAGPLHANQPLPPLGTRPAWPGQAPPVNRTVACYTFGAPNLSAATTGAGP
jgi:ABC-type transporter Mla subunit MlaD